jgi:uncharacterized repeat protein (TIGR03806 family)
VRAYLSEPYPEELSAWRLFVGRLAELRPNSGVLPYELNTPLFSDYAGKHRMVYLPPGQPAVYEPTGPLSFPVGTILSKTFSYERPQGGELLLETRLLVHTAAGWIGLPYVWNAEQTEAYLRIEGDSVRVWRREGAFDYLVPNVNQCKGCHDQGHKTQPLGPKAQNLNRDYDYAQGQGQGKMNQLAYWSKIGSLRGAPPLAAIARGAVWNDPQHPLAARARAYLDVNCAHCHNPRGPANTTGLDLRDRPGAAIELGVCKAPVAAGKGTGGRHFDIVPGAPDASILVYRMESTMPKVMMPELGRNLVHAEGVALVRQWIASLPPEAGPCQQVDSAD